MLNLLRKNKRTIFIIALLGIIPPFCFFGVDVLFRSLYARGMAGKWFGSKMLVERFFLHQQETRNQLIAQLVLTYGVQNSDQFLALRNQLSTHLTHENLAQLTWERLLLTRFADENGVPASEAEMVSWLAHYPLFQTNGRFDPQRYQTLLRNIFGVSALEFEKELKTTLKVNRLRQFLTEGVAISEDEKKEAFAQANQKVTVALARLEADAFRQEVSAAEEEIRAYYEGHLERFRIPEKIRARVLILKGDPAKMFDKATDLALALLKKPDAAQVAKEFGATLETSPLFDAGQKVLPQNVQEKLFTLEVGEFSSPVETQDGVYFVAPLEKKPAFTPKFEECRRRAEITVRREKSFLKARLAAQAKQKEIQEKMEKEKITFSQAAQKCAMMAETLPPFSRVDQPDIPEEAKASAFSLALQTVSEVIPTETGMLLFAVEKRESPEYKEDPELVGKILGWKKERLYRAWMEALKEKAQLVDLTAFLK